MDGFLQITYEVIMKLSLLFLLAIAITAQVHCNSNWNDEDIKTRLVTIPRDPDSDWEDKNARARAECLEQGNCDVDERHYQAIKAFLD